MTRSLFQTWRFSRAIVGSLALGFALVGCENPFYAEPADSPPRLQLAYSLATAGGATEAFDKADSLFVNLIDREGEEEVLDLTLPFAPGNSEPIQVRVNIPENGLTLSLTVEVRRGRDPLFNARQDVVLRRSATTSVDLVLEPVPSSVQTPSGVGPITALGDTVHLNGAVLFATGDTIRSAAVQWSTDNTSIVDLTPSGRVIALAEGTARLTASYQGYLSQIDVQVAPVVTSVSVSPPAPTIEVLDTVQLSAVAHDRRGNVLNRQFVWSVPSGAAASVNAAGQAIGVSAGATDVTATTQGVAGSSRVTVIPPRVASVTVTPNPAEVQVRSTVQLTATARDKRGNALARSATWASLNDSIATVDASGLVTGVVVGSTSIRATVDGISGSSALTVTTIPSAGEDVVVINDIDVLAESAGTSVNNQQFVSNLVSHTGGGRANGTRVWWDFGHASKCGNDGFCGTGQSYTYNATRATIARAGLTLVEQYTPTGQLVNIPLDVKVIWLWNPTEFFTVPEINALKQFAAEGGRIVFIGEHVNYYGNGILAENDFLLQMGAGMQNQNTAGCMEVSSPVPVTSLRPHQITTGMTGMTFGCSSNIVPVPGDYPLVYDANNVNVLIGVAKIDTTPITGAARTTAVRRVIQSTGLKVDPAGRPIP